MGFLGWGLFGALFGITDEINTRKQIKQHQPETEKTIARWQQQRDERKAADDEGYLRYCSTCVNLFEISPGQIQLVWECKAPDSSVATGFELYRNYIDHSTTKFATLQFIKGKQTYEYTDTLSSENPCVSYSVYMCGMYNGYIIRSSPSTGGIVPPTMMPVKLKKIDLHVESRNNGAAKLFWNRQNNVTTYKVYRSKSENEEDFVPIVLLEGAAMHYTDHNVNFGQTYTYFIQAVYTQDGILLDEILSNRQSVTIEKMEESLKKTRIENHASSKQKNHDFDNMDGHEFESFCATLLKRNGFKNVSVTKGSGDQGIDVLATKDGIKYGIQCKCYSSEVGNKAVQEAFSGKTFYNRHVGVVLTNNYFTPSAKELAEKNGIILWDRKRLLKMIELSSHNS